MSNFYGILDPDAGSLSKRIGSLGLRVYGAVSVDTVRWPCS